MILSRSLGLSENIQSSYLAASDADLRVTWLGFYEKRNGKLEEGLRAKVLAVSPAQIDRLLSTCRAEDGRRRAVPSRSDAAIRAEVPVRAECWSVEEPGWLEADTVAHCGGSMAESFIWTLTVTDVWTGWTELRAIWNRGQHAVRERVMEIDKVLPFAMKGWDTDNGGEFLNWALIEHFRESEPRVEVTRSRPYHKNDQAHVEQKNSTHARGLLGWDRLGHDELVEPCNELLKLWSLWGNLYRPTMRENDPFEMKEEIENRLKALWELCRELDEKDQDESFEEPREGTDPASENGFQDRVAASRRRDPSTRSQRRSPLPNQSAIK